MDAVEIRPLDPFDDAEMRAWYDVYRASETVGRDFHMAYAYEEVAASFRSAGTSVRQHQLSARLGGRIVGVAGCELPMQDNRHLARVAVGVEPAHWRRGIGSALLDHLEGIALDADRILLVGEASYPYDGPRDGRGAPAVEFATSRGFTLGLGDVQRVLDLPVPQERLDALTARAARKHAGYTFRQVTSPMPDDIVLQIGELRAAVETEAPTGEIEREREVVDVARIREEEATLAAMGRTRWATVAFAPDGAPAGYTEYVVPAHDPPWIYQWGTLVWRQHRGHALGLALKVRNTAWVQHEHRDRTGVRTWNAESNRQMIAVNDAMGFRPVERMGEFQKRLG